jgi:molybdenum cofactor cytidylyltransferase
MGLGGVILAAGESTRMGRDKALLPWPPELTESSPGGFPVVPSLNAPPSGTLLSAAIQALSPFCDFVIVVVANNEAGLRPVIDACAAFATLNAKPERGQFSSLQIGLSEVLNRGRDAAMVTLVDRPPPARSTLERLLTAFEQRDRSTWAAVPEFQGKHGHPILIGRELIEAFLKAPETSNAREVEHGHQERIDYVSVDDRRVALNVNTPEDYAALQANL